MTFGFPALTARKSSLHPVVFVPSLRERWFTIRNRLLTNPDFQNWAGRFFLTKPIARHRARALFDIMAGFVYSQTLTACVRLKLFDMLMDGPLTVEDLAQRADLSADSMRCLLRAAAALQLTQPMSHSRFGLGQLGAALKAHPSLEAMIEHHRLLYHDLSDPVALLRGELGDPQLRAFWAYARRPEVVRASPQEVSPYSALMAMSQTMVAHEVLDAYRLKSHRRLLDVGGGEGVFLLAASQRNPTLQIMLFDLPAVAARAAERFAAAGLGARAQAFGGDFFRDCLPEGADIISLVRVLHDHDDDFALAILKKVHAALPKGGTLLLAEPMAGTKGAEPAGDCYFGLYLAAMGSGRPRTAQEISALAREAGFRAPRLRPTATPLIVRVLLASA